MLEVFIDIILISAIIPLLGSVALYSRVSWHRSELGVFFMSYQFTMTLLWIFVLLLRHDFHLGLDRDFIYGGSIVIFVIKAGILWWGITLMFKYTVKERKRIDLLEEEGREG